MMALEGTYHPGDIMYSVQSNKTYDKAKHLDFKSSNYYNHNNENCLDIAKRGMYFQQSAILNYLFFHQNSLRCCFGYR